MDAFAQAKTDVIESVMVAAGADFLGAPPILACLHRSVIHCRKPCRQGCLRFQEVCPDSFNAIFGENRANWKFALHCSEEES
jgi:hypothetical protein